MDNNDLYLTFNLKGIVFNDFYDILSILEHCSSLVHHDIIIISYELVYRFKNGYVSRTKENKKTFTLLYSILKNIPNTLSLRNYILNKIIRGIYPL